MEAVIVLKCPDRVKDRIDVMRQSQVPRVSDIQGPRALPVDGEYLGPVRPILRYVELMFGNVTFRQPAAHAFPQCDDAVRLAIRPVDDEVEQPYRQCVGTKDTDIHQSLGE